jgi:Derlin-2/3
LIVIRLHPCLPTHPPTHPPTLPLLLLQLWRLATNLFFIAPFSIKFAFELVWLIQYGTILEKQSYMFNPADFVFMLLFSAGVLTAISMLIPQLGMVFNASPMIFMLVYVYSRNFPNQQTSIWGLVTIQTFYLPFAFLALTVIQGGDPIPDLLGIFVGHLWWYLTDLYPRQSGRHLLATPRWVQQFVASIGIGPAPAPAPGTAPVAAPSGFRAFRGSGRRLGDDAHTD